MGKIGIRGLVLALLALALAAPAAWAAPAVSGEFPVPGLGTNDKLVEGPDGNIWAAVENGTKDVAKITPAGVVTEYELGVNQTSGIARGPEGNLWLTSINAVTKFSPSDPEGTKVTTAIAAIATFYPIVAGPDGNMWVATENAVIKVPPGNPAGFQLFPVGELSPRDIDVAGSLLVVADAGAKARIPTFTTAGVENDYSLIPGGGSQGVAGAADGLIAYSQAGTAPEGVGLISPPNALPQIDTPGGGDPFGVALGSDAAFWIVRSAANDLARLTASGTVTFLTGLKNEPRQIAAGPDNTLWVSQTKTGEEAVVRISGLEPPSTETGGTGGGGGGTPTAATPPETRIAKGPKAKVKTRRKRAAVRFRFNSPDAGASFECRLVRRAGKKAKASKVVPFKACKSPRSYRLVPGRYRFEVRAVLNGTVDATPARRAFRVVRVLAEHR
jgi:streptogramin lyase